MAYHTPKTIGVMAKPVTVSGDTGNQPKSLNDLGIEYVFVGDSIGGRSSNESDYENG